MVGSDEPIGVERPTSPRRSDPAIGWGSDAIAEILRRLELPFISLNPGRELSRAARHARQLPRQRAPEIVLCLHEEHAVALAHGYAKVTGRPMAVALHSNVGLMHATMALFNAFCDRVPMVVLGATGPLDASRRRPWIDWIHTAADQAALIRDYVTWDDQPGSVGGRDRVDRPRRPADARLPERPDLRLPGLRAAGGAARAAAALPRPRPPPPAGGSRRPDPRAVLADRERARALGAAADPGGRARRTRRGIMGGAGRARRAPRVRSDHRPPRRRRLPLASIRLHPVAPGTFLPGPPAPRSCATPTSSSRSTGSTSAARSRRRSASEPVGARVISDRRTTARCTTAGARTTSRSPRSTSRSRAHPDPLVEALLARARRPAPRRRAGRRRAAPTAPACREAARDHGLRPRRGAARGRSAAASPASCAPRSAGRATTGRSAGPLDYLGQDGGAGLGSGPGHGGRRGARAARQRPPRGRGARRRRLADGRDGALDRRPLPPPAARRRRQQRAPTSTTRSTRSASRARARGRSRTAGSASGSPTPTPTSPRSPARWACAGSDRSRDRARARRRARDGGRRGARRRGRRSSTCTSCQRYPGERANSRQGERAMTTDTPSTSTARPCWATRTR